MAKTIEQLKAQSAEIKNATVVGENTATRVGNLFNDIVEKIEQETADGATTTAKLAPLAVTTEKIANGAVTTEKLAEGQAVIFDVSVYNNGTVFESLQALLSRSNLSTLIPTSVRHGGMSIRFIQGSEQSSDNKYVQYFLTKDEWSASEVDWEKMNLEEEVSQLSQIPFLLQGYIADGNGRFVPNAQFRSTDFIPVVYGNTIIVFGKEETADLVTCYDKDFVFVKVVHSSTPSAFVINEITIDDEQVRYIRCCTKYDANVTAYFSFKKAVNDICSIINKGQLDFLEQNYSKDFAIDGYIDQNGVFNATTSWRSTDYIPILKGEKYHVYTYGESGATSLIAFYDINKEIVSVIVADTTGYKLIEGVINDDNIYFFRTCVNNVYYGMQFWSVETTDYNVRKKFLELLQSQINDRLVDIAFLENGYVNENGIIHVTTVFKNTGYVPVIEGLMYQIKAEGEANNTSVVAFYDKNKNVISNVVTSVTGIETINGYVPSGACYMTTCSRSNTISNCYCKVERIHNVEKQIFDDLGLNDYKYKYGNNIRKPYDFTNKHFVVFGDSITAGTYSYDGGMTDTQTDAYITILANKLGVNFNFSEDNKAQGGTGFCFYPSQYPGKQKITDVILNFTGDADVIYIAGGTNDYQSNMPVGTLSDTTIDTVYGALYLICEYLKTNYPNAIVFFATPINYSRNRSGLTSNINSYRNAIFEVATMYGYNVVDCSTLAFPDIDEGINNPIFKQALIYDGIHPTLLGHKYMGENIASLLI